MRLRRSVRSTKPAISLTRYDNVGREFSYGFETDFSQKLFGDVLKINGSGRVFRSEVVSAIAQIDNRTWSYSGNLNAFITLPADFPRVRICEL
jgi:hypothetical protein